MWKVKFKRKYRLELVGKGSFGMVYGISSSFTLMYPVFYLFFPFSNYFFLPQIKWFVITFHVVVGWLASRPDTPPPKKREWSEWEFPFLELEPVGQWAVTVELCGSTPVDRGCFHTLPPENVRIFSGTMRQEVGRQISVLTSVIMWKCQATCGLTINSATAATQIQNKHISTKINEVVPFTFYTASQLLGPCWTFVSEHVIINIYCTALTPNSPAGFASLSCLVIGRFWALRWNENQMVPRLQPHIPKPLCSFLCDLNFPATLQL